MPRGQALLDVVPLEIGHVEKLLRFPGKLGKYRLQVEREQPEYLQSRGTYRVQLFFTASLLGKFPWLLLVYVLVGRIGESHDFPKRPAELTRVVGLSNPL